MANPQLENGHIKIANDLFDALCKTRISGEARLVFDVIIRKTYGFNKKEDAISLSQFCLFTGLRKSAVCHAIKKLSSMNLIAKKGNDIANIYRVNKDFDTWKPLPKLRRGVTKKAMTIAKKGNNRCQNTDIQKTVTKDNTTKDINTLTEDGRIEEMLKEGKIQHDYQFVGLEIFEKTGAPQNKKGECIRIAKVYPSLVNRALSFSLDYPSPALKWKMFLWKLNDLRKNEKVST